jgi:hypothetical protein
MLCSIRPPWPPSFRSLEELRRSRRLSHYSRGTAKNPEVRSGKCIRLAERPKGNVLRRPLPYAWDCPQLEDGLVYRAERLK